MKLRTSHIVCVLLMLTTTLMSLHAQGERDFWYFGQKAGMKFNGANFERLDDNVIERPIVFGFVEGTDNMICANTEDGQLMFYSEGRKFKNRLHQDLLNSPTNEFSVYFAQGAIARDPGNPNRYYVFVNIQDGLSNFLTYTVVDMSLDGGLGGLVPGQTHIVMRTDVGQHMVVARHANGRDSWLIVTRRGTYNAYLITENGIATSPVTSNEGVSLFDGNGIKFGMMQVSPNNELIAASFPALQKVFLLEFNDLNGRLDLVHEYVDADDTLLAEGNSTVEFSSNNQVMYYSGNASGINQFNISNLNFIPPPITIAGGSYPYFKLGPNGMIFTIEPFSSRIGAIQDPNVIGLGCNYDANVMGLGSATNIVDLPTFLQPKFPEGISFINICEGETSELNFIGTFRNPVRIEWDLGDGNTASGESISHIYSAPGTYTATAQVYEQATNTLLFTDTKELIIYATPTIAEPEDIYLCTEDTTIFFSTLNPDILGIEDPNIFNIRYYFSLEDAQLNSNEVIDYIPEIGTKTVWVRVENKISPTCHDIVSFDIVTPQFISLDIPTEQFICDTRTGLTLSAPDGFLTYSWSNGSNTQDTTVFLTGQYTLTVEQDFDDFICEIQTTVTVLTGDELPIIEEIKVLDWSQNHNSIEVVLDRSGIYEFSVDGINYQESPIFLNLPIDDYYVYVRDARCLQEIKSDKLFLLYYNKFFTPNGDGQNDYWQIINATKEENIEISIFDRYGKLLETMRYFDRGWDGTFNGIDMPTSDYWFRVVRQNGEQRFGHFTLKR